jgi:LAO/AO transport system kinase
MCGSSLQTKHDRGNILALVDQVKAHDIRAVSRMITLLENEEPEGITTLPQLLSIPHHSAVIGVTGYPGAGKSTLIAHLVAAYRQREKRVGVLAIDISSSLTGGALLGDRIRMQEHALDRHVFIRSMATRGQHGGLARATREARIVLEAAGYDVILIETIGVGQDEVDILDIAQTVVAVVAPGLGDEVQAMKAGLLEVAHIVVLNKGDHPGADMTLRDLRAWYPLVLRTVGVKGEGIPELIMAITEHQKMIHLRDHTTRSREERQQR